MKIIFVLGSVLGQRNAVGYRFGHIARILDRDSAVICHANRLNNLDTNVFCFPLGGVIFRILNFARTRIGVDLRKFSSWAFAVFAYRLIVKRYDPSDTRICITASEHLLINWLDKDLFQTYIDLPTIPWSLVRDKWSGISAQELRHELEFEVLLRNPNISVIPPSEFIFLQLRDLASIQAKVLEPVLFGVETSCSVSAKRDLNFVFLGNICLRKGFDILIRALDSGILRGSDLTVCGRVQSDIRVDFYRAQAVHKFTYLGYCPADNILPRAKFLILPSRREGCAKVIGEAIAHGVIPLTTSEAGWNLDSVLNNRLIMNCPSLESVQEVIEYVSEIEDSVLEMFAESLRLKYSRQSWSEYAVTYLGRLRA